MSDTTKKMQKNFDACLAIVEEREKQYGPNTQKSPRYLAAGLDIKLERLKDVIDKKIRPGYQLTASEIDTINDTINYLGFVLLQDENNKPF